MSPVEWIKGKDNVLYLKRLIREHVGQDKEVRMAITDGYKPFFPASSDKKHKQK